GKDSMSGTYNDQGKDIDVPPTLVSFAVDIAKLGDIMTPELLLDELKERTGDISHAVIFSGTVPLLSGFAYGDHFSGFMRDGALGREIRLEYDVNRAAEDE
ncbi:MAG: hypothetical protein IIY74_01890, partial [Firmicutes bacterium]|nr:hypothetical protein [Bacillota bacterium]